MAEVVERRPLRERCSTRRAPPGVAEGASAQRLSFCIGEDETVRTGRELLQMRGQGFGDDCRQGHGAEGRLALGWPEVRLARAHPRGAQEGEGSQIALGLLQERGVVGLAFPEEQEPAHDPALGLEVQGVGEPIKSALCLLGGGEDVQAFDPDLADPEGFFGGGRRGARQRQSEEGLPDQVPSSQELMYRSCSAVGRSIETRIASSFSRAISRSISSGTG